MQKIAGHHFSRPKNRPGIHFCHPKLPQIARWRAVRAFSDDIDLKQPTAGSCMHEFSVSHSENSVRMHACMICRSEFSPEWLNQRMHGHRPARIRSGGCMTGNRKIMPKKCSTEKSANVVDRRRSILNQLRSAFF